MIWLIVVLLVVVAAWMALRLLPAGADGHMPLPYLIAFTRYLWIPGLVAALLAAWSGLWWLTLITAALALAAPAFDLPYLRHLWSPQDWSGTQPRSPAAARGRDMVPGRPTYRVMTLNCRYGHADARAIVDAVRERDIAVLALQEMDAGLLERLDDAGLGAMLPRHQLGNMHITDNGGYNGIWTALPVNASTPMTVDIPAAESPGIVVPLASGASAGTGGPCAGTGGPCAGTDGLMAVGASLNTSAATTATTISGDAAPEASGPTAASPERTILFVSAHPKSPMRGCADWSRGIIGLGAVHETLRAGDIAVVMGDLNSTNHHPSFRRLLRSGFRDAAMARGPGRVLTFPSWLAWPRLELDHVLFTDGHGVVVDEISSFPVPGSDHLALTATLRMS